MERLIEGSSGLRHLRWGREILGTLEAHYEHNPRLSQAQREAVLDEIVKLRALVAALSGAVKPYRDFLERRRTQLRGMVRVGEHLRAEARDEEARAEAEAIAEGFREALANLEARERQPLKAAVRAAVGALRTGLDEMDRRLRSRCSPAFVESLYPALARGRTLVADAGDDDDDAAASG